MVIIAKDSGEVPRFLKTDTTGRLYVMQPEDTYHYVTWTDDTSGTDQTIWDPAAGKALHLTTLIIVVDKACLLELYDNATGTTIAMFSFSARTGSSFPLSTSLALAADRNLGARLTSDLGTTTAYVTAVGHEH